jgi:hypothetical protein
MESLFLSQLFGGGATQTSATLTISKADLIGLTASSSNTAESLLVAILLTALANFQGLITDENGVPITNENEVNISFDNSEAFELLKLIPWSPFIAARDNQACITNQIVFFAYSVYAD